MRLVKNRYGKGRVRIMRVHRAGEGAPYTGLKPAGQIGHAVAVADKSKLQTAVFAGGCFWCTEAVFQLIRGVSSVIPGYAGGQLENPKYEDLHERDTGHAECIQITYDPSVISYETLLQVFYYVHDPTTMNQQGNDVGSQYRSVIFYHDETQKETAEHVTNSYATQLWDKPIVTEIVPLERFWPAEDYHQNYYRNNRNQGYCQVIINPKLSKFRSKFESLLA